MKAIKSQFVLLKKAASLWSASKASRLGAALAFYTVFSIAPLFVIVLAIAGFLFGAEAARHQLFDQVNGLVGEKGGEAIQAMVAAADKPKTGVLATVLALGTLFVGATTVFVQLQDALNTVWNVRRLPGRGFVHFVKDRLVSFAIVVALGFLLLVSLVLSAAIAAVGKFLSGFIPANEMVWQIVNFIASIALISLLFALVFKVLPDVRIQWRDVWVGAVITSVLFNLGKFLLGLYIGKSSVGSAYGAVGSLIIVLLWVYYSSQLVLYGAAFTKVYSDTYGAHLQPVEGAEFVTLKEVKTGSAVGD